MTFQENENVELKAIVTEDVRKEIIAFANTNGGKLFLGVADDGQIVGLEDPDGSALQISNMVRDAIRPDLSMFLHYSTLEVEGKKIVEVVVQRGTERPYYIARKGLRPEGVYVRQGYSSVPATDAAIRRMIKETDGDHFEDMRSLEQELTFEAAKEEFARRGLKFEEPQMRTLKIINRDGLYTNLGFLLSDQCVHTIKVAVFQGTDQSIFKDRREFSGSLLRQLNDVYDFIDLHNQTHATFDKLLRVDSRDYPESAVREALLNAIVHREYAYHASTLISLYEDRMEVVSVGGLVSGIVLEDIMMGVSVCRNPQLANVFYHLQLIEAYGTGISKIMQAYKGAKRKPTFQATPNAFKVRLPNMNYEEDHEENGTADVKVQDEQREVLKLAEKGPIVRSEVEKLLGVSASTATRFLRNLEHEHLLTRLGRGKNTQYITAEK